MSRFKDTTYNLFKEQKLDARLTRKYGISNDNEFPVLGI